MVPAAVCVFAADMKSRKWSFSLEDYKRLSEERLLFLVLLFVCYTSHLV